MMFLQIPDPSGRRVLRPGKWIEGNGRLRSAKFSEADVNVETGQEAIIFYEINGKFMRQSVRINDVSNYPPSVFVNLRITGQPELAESRQSYRVSTVMVEVTATLGSERNCKVLDVSATGIAVASPHTHEVGEALDVDILYDEKNYVGRVHVATTDKLPQQRLRYGLLCVDDQKTNRELIKGLVYINLAVQRLHLRRLAQAG